MSSDTATVHAQRVLIPLAIIKFAPLTTALLLWIASLFATEPGAMTDLGLVSVLPPTFFIALALLILGFCLSLSGAEQSDWVPVAYITAWIAFVHATPAILYGSLRYAWAWKHVGIVEYIQRAGRIDPSIDVLPVYHNWPGFFGAASLITESSGASDALTLTKWAPFAFELLFAGGVLMILRASSADRRLVWFGVWVFAVTNWVGQDYFSPQAMSYFLYLVVVGICLWAFPARVSLSATAIARPLNRWAPSSRLLSAIDVRVANAEGAGRLLLPVTAHQRRGLLAVTLLLLVVIASSHQLTPVLLSLALLALVLFGQCRGQGLPILMALFTAAWLVTGASAFAAVGIREIVSSLGRIGENFSENLIDPATFSPGVRLVSAMARALTGAVGTLAFLGWMRRLRHGYLDVPLTLLGLTPLALLPISGYGGEILFRVYFYALPFMAFFVAALVFPSDRDAGSVGQVVATVALSGALAVGFLFAYYGHERMNYFPPGEIAATRVLDELAPDGALLIEASPNYPSRYRNYDQYVYIPLVTSERGNALDAESVYSLDEIVEMMSDRSYPAAYLIITRGQLAALNRPALASIEAIQREIEASGAFAVEYANDAATIYVLAARQGKEP